jgi:hypothetical protein
MAALVVVANVLSCLLCSMLGFLLSRLSKSLEGRRLLLVALK